MGFKTTTIFNAVNVGEETANDDEKMYIMDFNSDFALREFALKIKTVCNATAPGANNITFNIYWSNERIDTTLGTTKATKTELATSADIDAIALALAGDVTTNAYAVVNTASKTVVDDALGLTAPIRPRARYGYIAYDKPALDAGSDITMTVDLVRMPAVAISNRGNL